VIFMNFMAFNNCFRGPLDLKFDIYRSRRIIGKLVFMSILVAGMLIVQTGSAVTMVSSTGYWSNIQTETSCGMPTCFSPTWPLPSLTYSSIYYGDTYGFGCPSTSSQSGFIFTGRSGVAVTPETPFTVGTFTHQNRPISSTCSFSGATLDLQVVFASEGGNVQEVFSYPFTLSETTNYDCGSGCEHYGEPGWTCTGSPCSGQGTCPDRVTIPSAYSEDVIAITEGGVTTYYTVKFIAFFYNGNEVDRFFTLEGCSNPAELRAVLLPIDGQIAVTKKTNGVHYVSGPSPVGPIIPLNCPVTWTYEVTNPGNVPLSSVSVTDSKLGSVTSYTGDTNGNGRLDPREDLNNNGIMDAGEDLDLDGILDPAETWIYTATGLATTEGQYSNKATAQGSFSTISVTDEDWSYYYGCDPVIALTIQEACLIPENPVDVILAGDISGCDGLETPISYNWYKGSSEIPLENGADYSNAHTAELTILAADEEDEDSYKFEANYYDGCSKSATGTFEFSDPPVVTILTPFEVTPTP